MRTVSETPLLERFRLDGQVALVTGGGRGLGQGMALALGAAGAKVAVSSRTAGELAETVQALRDLGAEALALPADLLQVPVCEQVVQATCAAFGRLDILVTAAGMPMRKPIFEVTEADYDTVMGLNLKAVWFTSRAAALHMQAAGGGRMIHVASMTSEIGAINAAAYVATKGGIRQLTKAQAVEWAPYGITVNAIGPGWYPTRLGERFFADPKLVAWAQGRIPLGRFGQPADLAGATLLLASAAGNYITGQILYVDGGFLAS